jgi:hypothetical protein
LRWQARLGIARVEQQSQFQLQSPRQIWFSDILSNSDSVAPDVCEAASRRRGTGCTVTGTICPAKAMSERFGNLQTLLAPAAKLPPCEALRLPSALDIAAAPFQWVHGIGAVSETAVGGDNMDDE